ncbi:MAG: phytanoyl-CoA dioxygenase family protein [Nakamurella sp.]
MLTSNGYRLADTPARLGELVPVPDHQRGDRDALWNRLRRDGYLFLPAQLDAGLVTEFRRHYFSALVGSGLADGPDGHDSGGRLIDAPLLRKMLFGDIVPGTAYRKFCTQQAIRGWFEWFYDDRVFLHKRKILRHIRPGEAGIGTSTQAHYDLVYLREGTDRLLSAWIPLGDCPIERGPLIYLEDSHRYYTERERAGDELPAASMTADLPRLADQADTRWLISDFRAGDVMIHSPYMVHASLDNADRDRMIRLSTDIRYQRAGDPIDWRWQTDWHPDDGL